LRCQDESSLARRSYIDPKEILGKLFFVKERVWWLLYKDMINIFLSLKEKHLGFFIERLYPSFGDFFHPRQVIHKLLHKRNSINWL
jgi:hypothetical protein